MNKLIDHNLTQEQRNHINANDALKAQLKFMKEIYRNRAELYRKQAHTSKDKFPSQAERNHERAEELEDIIRDIDHALYMGNQMESFDLKEAIAAWALDMKRKEAAL
jgi:hypothetical protein